MGKHKKVKQNPIGGGFSLPDDSHSSGEESDEATGQAQSQIIKRNGRWSVNSKETLPAKPTTLRAYPALWVKCLESAKARMRLHIASIDAFPPITTAVNGPCNEVLLEILAEYQAEGRQLEKGKHLVLVSRRFAYLRRAETTYEKSGSHMCRLVSCGTNIKI